MKLSLNELEFDSYTAQLNEKEITEIKGGTSLACELVYFEVVIRPVVAAVGASLALAAGGICIPAETILAASAPN